MSQTRRGVFQRFIKICLRFGAVRSLGVAQSSLRATCSIRRRHCLCHMHTTHCLAEGLDTQCDADKVSFYEISHINPRPRSVCQSTRCSCYQRRDKSNKTCTRRTSDPLSQSICLERALRMTLPCPSIQASHASNTPTCTIPAQQPPQQPQDVHSPRHPQKPRRPVLPTLRILSNSRPSPRRRTLHCYPDRHLALPLQAPE
jgi:hypothetical protein